MIALLFREKLRTIPAHGETPGIGGPDVADARVAVEGLGDYTATKFATLQVMKPARVGPASLYPNHRVAEIVIVLEVRTLALVVGDSLRLDNIPDLSFGLNPRVSGGVGKGAEVKIKPAVRVSTKTSRPHRFSANVTQTPSLPRCKQ